MRRSAPGCTAERFGSSRFAISWNVIEAIVALLGAAEMLLGSVGQRIALCPTYGDGR